MLGIGSRFELFQRWVEVVTHATTHAHELRDAEDVAVCESFEDYVRSVVEERAAQPGDDLISAMDSSRSYRAQVEGEWVFAELFPDISIGDAAK